MEDTSKWEKWEIVVGKEKFIVSGKEVDFIFGNQNQRLIRFKDYFINPAFVQSGVLIEKGEEELLELEEPPMSEEKLEHNRRRIADIKKGFLEAKVGGGK